MKKETTQSFKQLEDDTIKNFSNVTKETVLTKDQLKKFTLVDLWAIHKNKKTLVLK